MAEESAEGSAFENRCWCLNKIDKKAETKGSKKSNLLGDNIYPEDYVDHKEEDADSSVTDSFSEDEIDYSPYGFDSTYNLGYPEHLYIQDIPLNDRSFEKMMTQFDDDADTTGETLIFLRKGHVVKAVSKSIIACIKDAKQFAKRSPVDVTRSPNNTLMSENYKHLTLDISVDALIFSSHFPVTVLTFTKDSSNVDHEIRRHNTYLASWLTKTLRDIDDSLSVLHGVVDVHGDLSETLETLRQQKLLFAFEDSLIMTPERCKKDLKYLFRVLSWRKASKVAPEEIEHDVLVPYILFEDLADETSDIDPDVKTYEPVGVEQKRGDTGNDRTSLVISLLVVQFAVHINHFFASYKSEVQGSFKFAGQKSIPVLYLLTEVIRLYRQCCHNHCWYLILSLLLFCIGDIIFVWKHLYLDLGIIVFAFAHLSCALAFEFRFDEAKILCFFAILGTVIFSYFGRLIENNTYHILAAYTVSVCLMSWRVAADMTTPNIPKKRQYLQGASIVCFIVCNVIIGVEVFLNSFPGSHLLSMMTYYLALFSFTVSVLLKYEMIEIAETTKTTTKHFWFLSAMTLAMQACFQFLSMVTNE